jgi:hypothetical protein
VVQVIAVAKGGTHINPATAPGAAAQHPWLITSKAVIFWIAVLVQTPLPNVARHVIQSEG